MDPGAREKLAVRTGIIGAGNVGGTLVRMLTKLGNTVSVANAHPARLAALAADTGANAVSVADVVKGADLVIVAIPVKNIPELPKGLFRGLPEPVIVVDAGNYFPSLRDGRIAELESGMAESVWVARQLGRPVIKAFNTTPAHYLAEGGLPEGAEGRIAMPVAGDERRARQVVMDLLNTLGFDAIDAGGLDESWRQQPGTPVHCTNLDVAGALPALLKADRARSPELRDLRIARMQQLPAGSTPHDRVLLSRAIHGI